jgi:hypothetical protein
VRGEGTWRAPRGAPRGSTFYRAAPVGPSLDAGTPRLLRPAPMPAPAHARHLPTHPPAHPRPPPHLPTSPPSHPTPQAMLEAISLSQPQPKVPPELLRFLGKARSGGGGAARRGAPPPSYLMDLVITAPRVAKRTRAHAHMHAHTHTHTLPLANTHTPSRKHTTPLNPTFPCFSPNPGTPRARAPRPAPACNQPQTFCVWQHAVPLLESHTVIFPDETRCFDSLAEMYRLVGGWLFQGLGF